MKDKIKTFMSKYVFHSSKDHQPNDLHNANRESAFDRSKKKMKRVCRKRDYESTFRVVTTDYSKTIWHNNEVMLLAGLTNSNIY